MGLPLAPRPLAAPASAVPGRARAVPASPPKAPRGEERPLGNVGRYQPFRHLSTGPEGAAAFARVHGADAFVELRYATVAHADAERWKSIEATAQIFTLLQHPVWVPLIDRDVAAETPVLVMEGFDAVDLTTRLGGGSASEEFVVGFAERIAHALGAAHRIGLVHGRIGPSFVRVTPAGKPLLLFPWLDVGPFATELDRACVPPEAGREALDATSDVYALGRLVAVTLLGRAPMEGDDFGLLGPLVAAMTSDDREARPSAAEACLALRTIARALAPEAARPSDATWDASAMTLAGPPTAVAIANARARIAPGGRVGRYHLVSKLGEGGMGEVFRAMDLGTGVEAAIKVLRADASADPAQLRRFRKEARILAEVKSPYVAGLLEVNQEDGIDYIALEFVDGDDLARMVEADGGRLIEREALAVVADVCRGLAEAHARGIVHRDIKPENVMIARPAAGADPSLFSTLSAVGSPRVKLCDFGIARVLDGRSGTLALTQEGAIIGTPYYMAPEQCSGAAITPATDVYALGITLFSLIAGRMPFNVDEPMALLVAHMHQAPPLLSSVCPEASEAVSALVARAIAKSPAERFVDASALLEAIERIERGEPTSIAVHPARPSVDPARISQHVFEWQLRASPAALWPFVSNTDRLNRVLGMAPATFERTVEGDGVTTVGQNRVAGVDLRWREYPFEWVEGRRWGVLRVFDRGVMHWFTIELELIARPEGGTLVRFTMTLEPKHFLGRLIVAAEMKWKQRPLLAKAFARIDGYALASESSAAPPAGFDPYAPPARLGDASRLALDDALVKLREDGVPGDVLDALASFCENASAQQVARLRPLAFAREQRLDPDQVVDACLRAAHRGLFVLMWDVLCPLCKIPSGFADSLRALADHSRCPACNVDFPLDFAQSLELVFRVSPEVRESEVRTYCVGGPAFSPHVVAQIRLSPGERLVLDLALAHGTYKIRSPQLPYAFALEVSNLARAYRGEVSFVERTPREEGRVLLAPGVQSLALENTLDREIVCRVERTAPREDALTAARASSLASFRRLFPGEVLASGRLVAVGRTAFVVTQVHGQRELLATLGDARTFERVLEHLGVLEDVVAGEGGAVVKTASGATLSAFETGAAATRAAIAIRARLDELVVTRPGEHALDVRIVVHQGPTVAATFDGRLDYFGDTVETALELVASAEPATVLLSSALAVDAHAMSDVSSAGHRMELVEIGADGAFAAVVRLVTEDAA